MAETVTGYVFNPADLKVGQRKPGISAFMRIRNGAAFLEPTIRSHIDEFDEIVAVYNQCTDDTPAILARLQQEFGERLRVYHYADRVFPPGSEGHARTAASDPASMVNYSNFALAQTRCRTVCKLDDDHIAREQTVRDIVGQLRQSGGAGKWLLGFSGLNIWRGPDGDEPLSVPRADPISGSGDIGFFDMREDRFFTHDKRFERTPRAGLGRKFSGFAYWHMKYLKPGGGFANYELESNRNSRFSHKRAALMDGGSHETIGSVAEAVAAAGRLNLLSNLTGKGRYLTARNRALTSELGARDIDQAVRDSVRAEFLPTFGLTS